MWFNREQLIKDVVSMSEDELQKSEYNSDLKNEMEIDLEYGAIYTPLKNFLSNLKLDKTLTLLYYREDMYNGDNTCFDALDFLFDYMKFDTDNYIVDTENPINTYNYDSNLECTIQYTLAYSNNDKYYVALEVHNGGDVRGNYSDVLFYEYTGDIDYFFDYIDSFYLEINDKSYDVYNQEVIISESGEYFCQLYELMECITNVYEVNKNLKIEAYPCDWC